MNKFIAIISKSDNICKTVTILQEVPAEDEFNFYLEVPDTSYTAREYMEGMWSEDVKKLSGGGTDMLSLGDIGKLREEITDEMTLLLVANDVKLNGQYGVSFSSGLFDKILESSPKAHLILPITGAIRSYGEL